MIFLLGSVIIRKARDSEDDLDKKEGLRKQLDDLTEAVKKLQEEFENDGKHQFVVALFCCSAIHLWLATAHCCLKDYSCDHLVY